jgi:sodium/proline symporter
MIVWVFVIYLAVMAGIGVYASRYNRDLGGFVLGGRRLGPWVAAFSAQASDFSAWLIIGLPGAAYEFGFSIVWTCIGCLIGVLVSWTIVAPALRRKSEQYNALTIPDFLESRFADRTHLIRLICVITILVYYASYIAAQFSAAGKTFQTVISTTVDDWPATILGLEMSLYQQGLLFGAIVILLYTAIGGFLAVCWTDFVQAILMVTALVVIPIAGIIHVGGPSAFLARLVEGASSDILTVTEGKTGASLFFGVVMGGLSWAMGNPGQPHIISRFMAIGDPKDIPKSTVISVVWSTCVLWGAMMVGMTALAVLGPSLKNPEFAMPLVTLELLPELFAAVILSGAIAAMMSTVDSQIVVAVSAVVNDVYVKLLGGHPSNRASVWISRFIVLGLGVGGVLLVWRTKDTVFAQVFDAWGGLAAVLVTPIILGCTWPRTNKWAVIFGMVLGFVIFQAWVPTLTAWNDGVKPGDEGGQEWIANLHKVKLILTVLFNLIPVVIISAIFPGREPEGTGRSSH